MGTRPEGESPLDGDESFLSELDWKLRETRLPPAARQELLAKLDDRIQKARKASRMAQNGWGIMAKWAWRLYCHPHVVRLCRRPRRGTARGLYYVQQVAARLRGILAMEPLDEIGSIHLTTQDRIAICEVYWELHWMKRRYWGVALLTVAMLLMSWGGFQVAAQNPTHWLLTCLLEQTTRVGLYWLSFDLLVLSLFMTGMMTFYFLLALRRVARVYSSVQSAQ